MPTSPALAEGLAEPLLRLYLEAELILLQAVARRLERGIDRPGWAEQKLLEVQALRRQVEAEAGRLTDRGQAAIEEAVRMAWNRGVATALADLQRAERAGALEPGVAGAFFLTNEASVTALIVEATGIVQSTHRRILRATEDAYRHAVAGAAGQVLVGSQTRRQAAQRALDDLLGRGIIGFQDAAGRSWDLASYVEMAMRTTTGQAAVSGHVDRLAEAGQDLVIVSDAPGECKLCRPWEGKVLSLNGRTPGRSTLAQARAAGLFHPNCRHRLGAYIPGLTRRLTDTADPEGDEARQRQRELERQVRAWKRRQVLALDDAGRQRAAAKVREWQAALRAHIEATGGKRLYYREGIVRAR